MKPKKTYKDKKYTFVRFGKINIFKQKGFKQNPEWIHNPPSTKGFYAFPYMSQEHFLLGSIQSFQQIRKICNECGDKFSKYKKNQLRWQEAYQKAVSQNFSRDYLEVFFDEKV